MKPQFFLYHIAGYLLLLLLLLLLLYYCFGLQRSPEIVFTYEPQDLNALSSMDLKLQ